MYERLLRREAEQTPIRVAVVGAGGSMGHGVSLRLGKTPGVRMLAAVDVDVARAVRAAELHGRAWTVVTSPSEYAAALHGGQTVVSADIFPLLERGREAIDILVESTNTVAFAARVVERALRRGIDVVLMNAEVDCLLGPLLHRIARETGTVVTSDAGDQHGVIMRLIDEMRLWGLEIVMAGNIKGFLDRYATPESIREEAKKRNLNPVMCAAYTDGTKLSIEMALVSNATGLVPSCCGMTGPRARHVSEVFEKFDFERLRKPGVVDYVLGAEPGGGVFIVGHCDDEVERGYLSYYKMGVGPFYLGYRPYHLCHLETPYAIATVTFLRQAVFAPLPQPVSEVVAFAKTDIRAGTAIEIGIGGEHLYGKINRRDTATALGGVPICLFDCEGGPVARVKRQLHRDQLVTWDDVELPEGSLLEAYGRQEEMLQSSATH